MSLNEKWLDVIPSMISACSRHGGRDEEFEKIIMQSPSGAADYAYRIIRGRWEEAESIIASNPEAAGNYARNVVHGRWEMGEDVIASDANTAFQYAKFVLRGRFEKGEDAIASNASLSIHYAKDILKGRFILGEPSIAANETNSGNESIVKNYYEMVIKNPNDWASWTTDQLKLSPCWMYMYAKEYIKSRLPDVLHNHMNIFAMTIPNNYWVKRYFKAKKYSKKIKRRKKNESIDNQGVV